ncbi:MAG: RraA family protein [bacterium]|nr:RraA family protein [bacterium]
MELTTPLLADACLRLGTPLRLAPPGLQALLPGSAVTGRVLPARHHGSVDVFLEAMGHAEPGDVLVIDNQGRQDEACIGDLTVLEAQACGLAGILVWGFHRDTAELLELGLPVFSYGRCPSGPRRLDPRPAGALDSARLGDLEVSREDWVFADADGAVFFPAGRREELRSIALSIRTTERRQAEAIRQGRKLRDQFRFDDYLARRAADPAHDFRRHLRELGAAIEE